MQEIGNNGRIKIITVFIQEMTVYGGNIVLKPHPIRKWFIIFLLLAVSVIAYAGKTYAETDYITKLDQILSELDTLFKEAQSQEDSVSETYYFVTRLLKENKLSFEITDNYPWSLLSASGFFVDDQRKAWISIDRQLIEAYPVRKELIFSMLIHEYRHAYDYFTVDDYIEVTTENEIERYLYEMDALLVEALFVKYYLVENGYQIGNFEKYLLASLEADDLIGASSLYKQVDQYIIYSTYSMVIRVNEGEIPLAELLEKIDADLEEVVNDLQKEDISPWEKYIYSIRAYTLHYYLPKLTEGLDGSKRSAAEIQEYELFAERANEKLVRIRQFLNDDSVREFLINYRKGLLEFLVEK